MEGNERNSLTILLAIIGVIILLCMMAAIFVMVQEGNKSQRVVAECNAYWIEQIGSKGSMNWLVIQPELGENISYIHNYSVGG